MIVAHGKQKRTTRKVAYIQRYGLNHSQWRDRNLNDATLSQLSFCKCDEARRLVLGVSIKFADGERAA